MFDDLVYRKYQFDEALNSCPKKEKMTPEQIEALSNLFLNNYMEFPEGTDSFDSMFPDDYDSPDYKGLEWIVKVGNNYFYVNTEGYDYARYIAPISQEIMQEVENEAIPKSYILTDDDKDMIVEMIKDGELLEYMADELGKDKEVIMDFIEENQPLQM